MRSITITANLAPGYTLGEALDYLNNIASEQLPDDVSIDYRGESQLYQESGSSVLFVFALALAIIISAVAHLAFYPPLDYPAYGAFSPAGRICWVVLFQHDSEHLSNRLGNAIGLAAKNGILIVEFANQLRDAGYEFEDALRNAAAMRLRPICHDRLYHGV